MLSASLVKPMRKALVLVFAILIIGVAPAMALIGLCANNACCVPSGDLGIEGESCCGELPCDERDVSASETAKKQSTRPIVVPCAGMAVVIAASAPPAAGHEVIAVRPLSERLASLSILLI